MVTVRKRRRPPAPPVDTRSCLKCQGAFPKVAGIFVCTACKKAPAWQSAAAYA
jgi:hypothetical protein